MNLQEWIEFGAQIQNTAVVPILLSIAFIYFLSNIVRYFILGGANEDGREKARRAAMWGIFAFVIILTFWGVVKLLVYATGLGDVDVVPSDYVIQREIDKGL